MKLFQNVRLSTRSHLKVFSIFSSGRLFVQQGKTILAILVEGDMGNISVC